MENDPLFDDPLLLVRPTPRRHEGPRGYLHRLAEDNCLTVKDLTQLGISYRYDSLASAGMLPAVTVDPGLHASVQRISALWEQQRRVWNQQTARWCPLCLMEDRVWKASWELLFHDACPDHHVWLVDRCSSCGETVKWGREHLLRCECGSDLRTETTRGCPEQVARLSAILEARIADVPHETLPHLVGLNIEQLQRVIRFIGGYLDPAAGPKPLKIRRAGSLDVSWTVTTLAAETLFQWPQAFFLALDRLQAAAGDQKVGLREALGRAYLYLSRIMRAQAFEPIREQFQIWVAEHWRGGVARRNRSLPPEILAAAVWVPAVVATTQLGISPNRLKYLIVEGVLDGEEKVSSTGRRFLTVRKDQLDNISQQLVGEMDIGTAMTVLGFGKVRMRKLLRLIFPAAHRVTRTANAQWSIPRNEVEALLAIGEGLPAFSIAEEDQVSMAHILRYWTWPPDKIVGLIEDVKAQKLSIHGLLDTAVGVGRWVLERKELKAWELKVGRELPHWMSVVEVASALRVHQQAAYWLVHEQLIHAESLPGTKGVCFRISRGEVERFLQSYRFCTDIAAELGVSPRKAKSILAGYGVHPVAGNGADYCRQLFYARTEALTNALIAYDFGRGTLTG